MKYATVIAIGTLSILLASCEDPNPQVHSDSRFRPFTNGLLGTIFEWKDPHTECVYYYRNDGQRGGLTIKFKRNGKPDCPGSD
jgi:hypothetical protein